MNRKIDNKVDGHSPRERLPLSLSESAKLRAAFINVLATVYPRLRRLCSSSRQLSLRMKSDGSVSLQAGKQRGGTGHWPKSDSYMTRTPGTARARHEGLVRSTTHLRKPTDSFRLSRAWRISMSVLCEYKGFTTQLSKQARQPDVIT